MHLSTLRGAALAMLLSSAWTPVHAETPSYRELLASAQGRAPQLLEQAAQVRAAQAQARQAAAWRNPTLSATYENLGAKDPLGISQREDTYTITQTVELGGKRAARIEAEQRRSDAASRRARQTELAFATALAVAYATAEAAQQRRALTAASVERARDDLRAAESLVKAGREAPLRVAQARAGVAAAQAELEAAQADAVEALEHLSALAGAPEPFTNIDHPFLSTVRRIVPAVDWTPDQAPALVTASAERDVLAAEVRVEEHAWLPDLALSAGMRRFPGTGEKAATVGLSANIPLFDRNRHGTDAARERAAAANWRLDAARREATAARRGALAQADAAERRLAAAEDGEAAAAEAYRLGRIGYDAGKTALLELLATRRALAEAQNLTIEARLARVRALADLSLAEGRPVFGEAP